MRILGSPPLVSVEGVRFRTGFGDNGALIVVLAEENGFARASANIQANNRGGHGVFEDTIFEDGVLEDGVF